MKILFINSHTGTATMPLASACLAAILEREFGRQADCPFLELPPGFPTRATAEKIFAINPNLIALTLYSWSREDLLKLSDAIAETWGPDHPPIIAGGPEVTADPLSIQNRPSINLAVSGEGETAITAIVGKLLPLSRNEYTPALSAFPAPYSQPGAENLDNLPSPFTASALEGRTYEDTVWELTRGCPFNCHFCFESKGSDRVRHKSLSRAAEELRQLQKRDSKNVFLLDPTFNASPERAKELLRLFINRAPELRYHLEVRSEFLDEEQAELYAELGCTLQIGLQTAHPDVARNIGRPFSPETFQEKLLPLHEHEVPYGLDLIYGLPGDSLEGFRESLDFALGCAPNHLDIFPLSVLPGTRLRETAGGLGLLYLEKAPYTVTGSKKGHGLSGFSSDDLKTAVGLNEAVNLLYNRGRAVPWFLLCCEALELRPVEIIEACYRQKIEKPAESQPADEAEYTACLGPFIQKLAVESDRSGIAEILKDIVVLLTVEGAFLQGIPLPMNIMFTYNPSVLYEHLEMGINDIEELLFFVPEKKGSYSAGTANNRLTFSEK